MYTLDYKLPFSTIALICEADYFAKIHFNFTYISFLSLGVDGTNRTHMHMRTHAHVHVHRHECSGTGDSGVWETELCDFWRGTCTGSMGLR